MDGSVSADEVAQVTTLLHGSQNLAVAIEDAAADRPADGSSAAEELARQGGFAGSWGSEPLTLVHMHGRRLAASAADHVVALASLVDLQVGGTAAATLVGHLAHASTSVWWVWDPSLELRGRLARGWTDAWRWANDRDRPPRDAPVTAQVLNAAAQQLGFDVVGDPPVAIDEPRPSTAALVDAMAADLSSALRQRLLAAVEDALSAPLAVPARSAGAGGEAARDQPGGDVVAVTGLAALVYVEAFARKAAYYGWDQSRWRAWQAHTRATLEQSIGR